MGELVGRVALITGASRGIGYELARCCAREGAELVLVSRNAAALEEAARHIGAEFSVPITCIPVDLSRSDAVGELCGKLAERDLHIDVLINNAGVGSYGLFHRIEATWEEAMVRLNVQAPTELTRALVPDMIANRWGRILNVSSVAGFLGVPYMTTYAATKAYVLAHSVALRQELRPFGISVTCLAPGTTATDFLGGAHVNMRRTPGTMSPREVAEAGMRGLLRGKAVVVPGVHNKAMTLLARLISRDAISRLAEVVMRMHRGTEPIPPATKSTRSA